MAEAEDNLSPARTEPDIARLAVEHMLDLVSVLDRDGHIVYASPSHEPVLGYSPDELVGTNALLLVHPADRGTVAAAISPTGGSPPPVRMRHHDGRWLIVEGRITAIPRENGEPSLLLSVSRDVTARTRAERRRDAQYAVTRVLAEARTLRDGAEAVLRVVGERLEWDVALLWRADADAGVLRRAAHWCGETVAPAHRDALLSAEQLERGQSLPGRVWERAAPAWVAEALADRGVPQGDATRTGIAVPVPSRAGVWGVLEYSGAKIRRADPDRLTVFASFGAQLGQFIERTQAEQALHESRAMLEAVVDGTSDAVFVKDRAGRYLLINEAGAAALGRPVEAVVGIDDAELMTPAAAADIMARDRAVMESGKTVVAEERVETEAGARLFLSTKAAYRDSGGAVQGVIGIAHDITERRRLEAELQQAQKMEAIGRLAGGVAHDFNNILSVIRGFSDLARKQLAGTEPAIDEWLRHVARASDQGTGLTRQLLAFSRRQPLDTEVLELDAVVVEMDALLRRVLGEDLRLVTVFGASRGTVDLNRGRLEQVIMNLAVNARDAMPTGGKLTIETADVELGEEAAARLSLPPGPYVALRVADTGTGMDADTRLRIFEPFFTTKAAGRGTGLGLSTVYGIVTQAGGHISVQSSPGAGTTFVIHLPVARPTAGEPAGEETAAPTVSLTGTLLVAEDDDVLRRLVRTMLESGGYDVLTARSGEEALARAQAFAGGIDALVTDVIMPGMRGPELANRLRALRPELRVVFMTGYSDVPLEHDLRPGDMLLMKPFGMEALLGSVGAALSEPGARRAAQ